MDIHETNRLAREYQAQAAAKRAQADGYQRMGIPSLADWFYREAAADYKAAAQVYRNNGWQDGLADLDAAAAACTLAAKNTSSRETIARP